MINANYRFSVTFYQIDSSSVMVFCQLFGQTGQFLDRKIISLLKIRSRQEVVQKLKRFLWCTVLLALNFYWATVRLFAATAKAEPLPIAFKIIILVSPALAVP